MNVTMDDMISHTSGKAGIMGEECKKRSIPEVTVNFRNVKDNTVQIFELGAKPRSSGYGSQAMREICSIADRHKINLLVVPMVSERKRLVEFYSRFGFWVDGYDMRRLYRKENIIHWLYDCCYIYFRQAKWQYDRVHNRLFPQKSGRLD